MCQKRGGSRWGLAPARHLLSLPRGRGPSQTPKFLSPGPPSPWLPALLIGKCFCRFCGEPQVQPRGCKGRSPLHKKTQKSPPSPPGKIALRARAGVYPSPSGKGGQKSKLKARSASEAENSFKSPPVHPCPRRVQQPSCPKNAAGARQATGGRRRRTDPPNAEGKAGGREPRCTGHPEAQPRRDPPESG